MPLAIIPASPATGTLPTSARNRALPSIVIMLSGRLFHRHLLREDVRGIDLDSKDAPCLVSLTLISESETNLSERLQIFKVILKSYLEQVWVVWSKYWIDSPVSPGPSCYCYIKSIKQKLSYWVSSQIYTLLRTNLFYTLFMLIL